jgi:hypothetical protein
MMAAARTSETLENFYQITWHYNPKDIHVPKIMCMECPHVIEREVSHDRLLAKLLNWLSLT